MMSQIDMSQAEIFSKALKFRNIFKQLSQLTWSIREAEQKFSIQDSAGDLLALYIDFAQQLLQITDLLKLLPPLDDAQNKNGGGA